MKFIKNIAVDFALSLSFISRIPVKLKAVDDWQERIKRVPIYFPAVGYLPGIIYSSGRLFSAKYEDYQFLIITVSITLGYYFFDLFHFDGLLDMFDGFLNQSNRERRLEIMAKGNVGPFAVFFGTLYVIIFYELAKSLNWKAFLIAAVLGRYEMNVLLSFSQPAKRTGLGAMLFPYKKLYTLYATIFTLPLAFFGIKAFLISLLLAWFAAYIISKISGEKIGGITGDVLGGSCLISQMVILLTLSVIKSSL
ncbi:adenosylcobinamide-GDP ribazoletransferase [Fervidobacterium sp.]